MTTKTPQNAKKIKEIEVSEEKTLRVTFSGAGRRLIVNGQEYSLKNKFLVPIGQRVYEVGQRLRDGTVVFSVDLEKNEALFVPTKIFGGKAKFDNQNNVVESANKDGLHGHQDWRRITDDEGETLSKNWDKVAPAKWQGRAEPHFWLASPTSNLTGRLFMGCEERWDHVYWGRSNLVPVVRSGPARILDI